VTQPAPDPTALDASGNPAAVPYAQLGEAWKAGHAQPIAGQTYYLQHANGAIGHTDDPAVMHAALEQGARFIDPAEAHSAIQYKELEGKSGGAVGAFAGGALEQGTLGLSDVAGEGLGGEEYGRIREHQRQAHPYASMLGEGLGAVGLAAVTGGGSLAEQAAGTALRGAGEGVLARVGTRALLGAARAGVEGAQMGVAQAVSDAAFDNHKLTASQIASTIGMNALWGAGGGAGLSVLGSGVGELGSRLFGRTAVTDADLATVAGKALGEEPSEGLGASIRRGYSKLAGAVSGKDPDAILNVLENRADLADADEIRSAAAREIRASGDAITRNADTVREIWGRGAKHGYVANLVDGVDSAEAARASRDAVDRTLSVLDEMAKDPEQYGNASSVGRAIKLAKRASDRLDAATSEVVSAEQAGRPVAGHVAEMYSAVDDLKKEVGTYTARVSRAATSRGQDAFLDMQNSASASKLQDLHDTLRTGLEDEATWGPMGTAQREVNQIYTNQIDASKRFNRALTTDIGRDPEDPWGRMTGVDPAKVDGYVRNLTNPSQDLTHQAVNDYVDHTEALTQKMLEHFDLAPAERAAVQKVADAAATMRDTLTDTSKRLSTVNQYQKLLENTGGHAVGFGYLAGHMLGGHLGGLQGMALGKVASIFTRPAETIHQLAVVEKMVRESDSRIARALRGFAGGVARTAKPLELDSYGRKAAQAERIAANPAALNDQLVTRTAQLRASAPKLADAVVASGLASAQYLRSKLPPRLPADPFDPKEKPLQPSDRQKEAFLRTYKAVEDPLSVVDDLRDGRLTLEGVDALKTLHPDLYGRVQENALDMMASGKLSDLSTQQRTGYGLLLGLPVPTLDPSYVTQRQQAWSAPFGGVGPATIEQNSPPQAKPSKRSKPVDLTKSVVTLPAERLEAGGGAHGT
jgi:hypothetical protein